MTKQQPPSRPRLDSASIARQTQFAQAVSDRERLRLVRPWPTPDTRVLPQAALAIPALRTLADFPKPPTLSKRGLHMSASCYPEEGHWEDLLAQCRDMNIGWLKWVDDAGGSGINVYRKAWHTYKIMPIIRFYMSAPGQVGPREADAIKRILDTLGFPAYIEICNEPDLPVEWPSAKQPKDWLERSVDSYCYYAPIILDLGALPGTFSLASGAFGHLRIDQYGNVIDPVKTNFVKMIHDRNPNILGHGGWISMHNYLLNHDPAYPYDAVNQEGRALTQAEYNTAPGWAWDNRPLTDINTQRARDQNPGDTIWEDDSCFGAYKIFQAMLHEIGLDDVPLLTTEGGPCMTDGQDGRYPKVHPALHPQMMEQVYRELGPNPQYFTYCPWMLYNTTGGWSTCCWVGGSQDHSRTITAMKTTPLGTWGEKFGQEAEPPPADPPPTEPPDEEEPPVPEPDPRSSTNDASAYGVTVSPPIPEPPPGAPFWRALRVHHMTAAENDGRHNVYVTVYDDQGRRLHDAKVKGWWGPSIAESGVVITDKPDNEPGCNFVLDSVRQTLNVCVIGEPVASDVVLGMNTNHPDEPPAIPGGDKGNTLAHHSYEIDYIKDYWPGETEPTEPPTEPPADLAFEDWLRNEADNHPISNAPIPYTPEFAFDSYARAHGLGAPLADEWRATRAGVVWAIKKYAMGVAFTRDGVWADIGHISY